MAMSMGQFLGVIILQFVGKCEDDDDDGPIITNHRTTFAGVHFHPHPPTTGLPKF